MVALPSKLGIAPKLRPVLGRMINVKIALHFVARFFHFVIFFPPLVISSVLIKKENKAHLTTAKHTVCRGLKDYWQQNIFMSLIRI